jgi:hypothetical protein
LRDRAAGEETGGRAVVNNNDPEREVPAILEESRTYYLIDAEAGGRSAAVRYGSASSNSSDTP